MIIGAVRHLYATSVTRVREASTDSCSLPSRLTLRTALPLSRAPFGRVAEKAMRKRRFLNRTVFFR